MTPHNFDASFNQILIPEKIALASLATDTTADVYVGKSLFWWIVRCCSSGLQRQHQRDLHEVAE